MRHSLAHLMAYAVQQIYPGVVLGIGPAIEDGFYYDFGLPTATLSEAELTRIEQKMRDLIAQNIIFKKKIISKEEAQNVFKDQPHKLELIKELPDNKVSIYKSGGFTDLCKGPHVKSTKEIPADSFQLTKIAGAYWKGSKENPMLTRIYGVAFASKKELQEYLRLQEEAEKRDHRKLGTQLDLFSFHAAAPGAVFWHPKGMVILKELERWWREEHEKRNYLETSTPILVKKDLFVQSGHWEHYQENMFAFELENQTYTLKPMNCPESTLIYASKTRSYRDLPLRLSEIGRLHRNELSGVLAGLFRVRQLTMDDAHIYCAPEHIQEEISQVLALIKKFYNLFRFVPRLFLATRPENFMGEIKLWNKAEKALAFALKKNNLPFEIKPKDGAFYGPKIDVHITDALKRSWQMATIQLDFQMPLRFSLSYIDRKNRKKTPLIIHRAIFGSFERFIGVLLEHTGGNLPLWLAPEQIWLIPIAARHKHYAKTLEKQFRNNGVRVVVKDENETVSKKIRDGELQKIPYLALTGDKEIQNRTLRLRIRSKGDVGEIRTTQFIPKITEEIAKRK